MSNRTIRINELVQREINDILRRQYQAESIALTVTEVRVAPDLRDARVFVGIIGTEDEIAERLKWIRRHAPEIRRELGRRITIKFMPRFEYVIDESSARGARVLHVLGELMPPPIAGTGGEAGGKEGKTEDRDVSGPTGLPREKWKAPPERGDAD